MEVNNIVEAFEKYSETFEKSLIKEFSLEELQKAKTLCIGYRNSSWYSFIEDRIDELAATENSKENRKFKIKLSIWNILWDVLNTMLVFYREYSVHFSVVDLSQNHHSLYISTLITRLTIHICILYLHHSIC